MTRKQLLSALKSMAEMYKFHRDWQAHYGSRVTIAGFEELYAGLTKEHRRAAMAYKASIRFIFCAKYPMQAVVRS